MGKTFLKIVNTENPIQDLGGSVILNWPPGLAEKEAGTTKLENHVVVEFQYTSATFGNERLRLKDSCSYNLDLLTEFDCSA